MNIDEKIKILGLTPLVQEKIKMIDFICYKDDLNPNNYSVDTIFLDDLVGTYRSHECNLSTNWLTYLEQTRKGIFFETYKNRNCDFERFLLQPTQEEIDQYGLPEVVKIEKGYLIYEQGKHRLTIAKLLGIEAAKVIVHRY